MRDNPHAQPPGALAVSSDYRSGAQLLMVNRTALKEHMGVLRPALGWAFYKGRGEVREGADRSYRSDTRAGEDAVQ